MRRIIIRKLEETSWLAQDITDRMEIELSKNGESNEWSRLKDLRWIVRCADTNEWGMHYDNDPRTNNRLIIVPNIPCGMQPDFLALAHWSRDDEGHYTMIVYVTHDLNSAVINVSRLMDAMRGIG